MKIACIDKTDADREALKSILDRAYADCRDSIGHIEIANYYTATKDQEIISGSADIALIGPGFNENESFICCKTLKELKKEIFIVVFLNPSHFDLCSLNRFSSVADEVFRTDEDSKKIIHKISSVKRKEAKHDKGKLLSVIGTKGGVGTTSIVSGLAHAAESIGKRALVLDLSAASTFCHYMGIRRWHSPEYKMLLQNKIALDREELSKCIAISQNGVHLLLPPAEPLQSTLISSKARNAWLRDENCLELSLHLIELLKESFDVIIVDTARVESLLSFALIAKSDSRLLVSSNDPASVHLLRKEFDSIIHAPFAGQTQILLNETSIGGQTKESVIDYLKIHGIYHKLSFILEPIPFEKNAKFWIGTGNTFYTEASIQTQKKLDQTLSSLLLSSEEVSFAFKENHKQQKSILKFLPFFKKQRNQFKALTYQNTSIEEVPDLIMPKNNLQNSLIDEVDSEKENIEMLYSEPVLTKEHSDCLY